MNYDDCTVTNSEAGKMRIGQSSHCSLNLISGFLSFSTLSYSSLALNPMFAESFML